MSRELALTETEYGFSKTVNTKIPLAAKSEVTYQTDIGPQYLRRRIYATPVVKGLCTYIADDDWNHLGNVDYLPVNVTSEEVSSYSYAVDGSSNRKWS